MELASYATAVAARLLPAARGEGGAELLAAVLRALAKGRPVQRGVLATTLGWPDDRLTALLNQEPCTEMTPMAASSDTAARAGMSSQRLKRRRCPSSSRSATALLLSSARCSSVAMANRSRCIGAIPTLPTLKVATKACAALLS